MVIRGEKASRACEDLSYPVFDADNHMYETTDAFTKYLPAEYEGLVKYVQVNGRTKIALRNVISEYIPNPTFNKVAPPGAQELEFRLKNPSSKHSVGGAAFGDQDRADAELAALPPRYIESPPAFFNPAERLKLMDEQKVDRAMMWPTLASLLEERLADDPKATAVVVHALNEWMLRALDLQLREPHLRDAGHQPVDRRRGDPRARLRRRARRPRDPDPAGDGAGLRRPSPVVRAAGVRPVLEARSQEAGDPRRDALLRRRLHPLHQRVGRHHQRDAPVHARSARSSRWSTASTARSATRSTRSSATAWRPGSRTCASCRSRTAASGCRPRSSSSRSSTSATPRASTRTRWWPSSARSSSTRSSRRT